MLTPEPFFLDGKQGSIFVLQYSGVRHQPATLILPPFGEEMNKSRRMLNLLALEFAAAKQTVLLPDYYGTGDSGGDFRDARFDTWSHDLNCLLTHLCKQGYPSVNIVAVRAAALLMPLLDTANFTLNRVALWQPVTSGKQWLTQWLRLRLAATMASADSATNTPAALRAKLAEGMLVEAGGYTLHPQWANTLDTLKLPGHWSDIANRTAWFEMSGADQGRLTTASANVIAQLEGEVNVKILQGTKFWNTQEIVVVPELISATADWLQTAT